MDNFAKIFKDVLTTYNITQLTLSKSIKKIDSSQGATSTMSQWYNDLTTPSIVGFYYLFWGLMAINKKAALKLIIETFDLHGVTINNDEVSEE
ncbi:MAG: hypothetical protein AAGA83_00260 [Cyanobacteria bacterium P01_F01_bin.116]